MTENQRRFKELYTAEVINGAGEMGEELLKLFDAVLAEFNGHPEEMSMFIQSIIDEQSPIELDELEQLQQENAALRERLGMTESAVLELARMILK